MKKFILVLTLFLVTLTAPVTQFISAQHHWFNSGRLSHTHVECDKNVLYTIITGQIAINCQFQMFKVPGRITLVWSNMGSMVWNDTHAWSWTPPNNEGNPNGVVIITGLFFIDPSRNTGTFPQHGWGTVALNARTEFNDGSQTDTTLYLPLYSMLNPTEPERPLDGDGILLRAECSNIIVPGDPGAWGALISEFRERVPINTLTPGTILNPEVVLYNYAGFQDFPIQFAERRLDANLHMGIPGTLVTSSSTFDTTRLVAGDHKFSFNWTQATGPDGVPGLFGPNRQDSCLIVVPFTIDGNAADVCPNIDGIQTEVPPGMILENGQCVLPTVNWQNTMGQLQRLNDDIRILLQDGKTLILGTAR